MQLLNAELRQVVLIACSLLLASPRSTVSAQGSCPSRSQQRTYKVVHEQAISINTHVASNTTFHPLNQVTVTIKNAPTSLDGTTTFRCTETRTYSEDYTLSAQGQYQDVTKFGYTDRSSTSAFSDMSVSLNAPLTTPTKALNDFLLLVQSPNNEDRKIDRRKLKQHRKRQSGNSYIAANGTATNDCTQTPVYAINSGVLTATVKGVTYTYSTSPGSAYAQFIPYTTPGSITTSFSLGSGGALNWLNTAFYNGQASFCVLNNGTVYAVFQQNGQPDGCMFIQLTLYAASSCQGLQLSTITGPTDT